MDLGLKGRKALVTGGTRGIGRAIVDMLAGEGCDVALCARDEAQVKEAVEATKAAGVNATGAAVDVADDKAVTAWIDAAAKELGGLDICIANVSALAPGLTRDDWEAAYRIDMMATVSTMEAVLPHVSKSDAGALVAISSISGLEAPTPRPYGAMKAALIHYMSGLSRQLAPQGIRANSVSPGTIYFEGGVWNKRELEQPEIYKGALKANPMGRMGKPEEVAYAAVMLASPKASFITGTNLVVDGAFTVGVQF
jgi:NAD(P)-dependent dehydrogenase (short-subunit alcohol dehydrogenase family)